MNYSVLVVDDEECIRELCEDVLPMWGYEVDTAEDGFEGIEKAKNGNYEIILTDVRMPDCDGITLLDKVKSFNPQIEVIVMTAYGTIETAVNAMKKGAHDFIMKPLSIAQMQAVLAKCVEKIQLKNENRELTDLNRKLRELNEMKEKFITITSHELRTPVCSISGYIELLKYTIAGIMEEDPAGLLDEMSVIVRSLSDIVSDMHDLAAIDGKGFHIKKCEFDLAGAISHVKSEFLPVLRDRKLDIAFNSEGKELIFNGDKRRLSQAVRELLQNSIKFTPDGGRVEMELVEEKGKKVIFSIKDTGIGIPANKIDSIFEKFYEVQDTSLHSTSDSAFMGGGLGLGLSLVKEIVNGHGGTVAVVSKEGKGSLFTIELPLSEE